MSLHALFVDFNSYFASVEQELQPRLRGKPVAVVPVLTDSTCCIAASYEAKRFGIKTGTNVGEARKLCPGLRVVEARPALYVGYHNRLVQAVDSRLPVTQVCSIDEMCCDLTGRWQQRDVAIQSAREIKAVIARDVGAWLKCSIGIAPNPFLAKTASDMQKPDGLVVIEPGDLPDCLHRLELRDLCGIGRNMERRMCQHGIHTVAQLCAASKEDLRRAWGGIEGDRFHAKLRGERVPEIETNRASVSHSHVLPPELREDKAAFAVLNRLLQKAAMRLRQLGYLAAALGVNIRYVGRGYWSDEIRFLESQDTLELLRHLHQAWSRRPRRAPPPLAVGVVLFHLVSIDNHTARLWEKLDRSQDRTALNRAMDRINERFGKNTVYFGGAHTALAAAPMRIAFSRIPDLQIEGD